MDNDIHTRIINRFILPHINRVARDTKNKDVLSILYLIFFANYVILSLNLVSKTLKPILTLLEVEFTNTYYQIDAMANGKETFIQYKVNIYDFLSQHFMEDIKSVFVTIVPMILCFIIGLLFNKMKFKSTVIVFLSTILIYTIFLSTYLQTALIIIFLVMLISFYPLGSGRYFKIIQYLNYFESIIYDYFQDRSVDKNKKRVLIIVVSFFSMIYFFVKLFSITIFFSILLTLLILLFLWLYESKEEQELYILKKVFIYFIFCVFTLFGNKEVDLNFVKFILSFITIFFALDRVVAISKEIHKLILSKSVLYYYEQEDIKNTELLKKLIDLKYISNIDISEKDLVIQMIIRLKLNLTEEFLLLEKIYYEKEFINYKHFVKGNSYFINSNDSWLEDLVSLEKQIFDILNIPNQKIFLPKLFEEYAIVLFRLGKYELAIKYFEDYIIYLNDDSVELLCIAHENIGNKSRAEKLRKQLLC